MIPKITKPMLDRGRAAMMKHAGYVPDPDGSCRIQCYCGESWVCKDWYDAPVSHARHRVYAILEAAMRG